MTNTHLFRVGDTVELRLDVLEKEGSDPGSLIDWYKGTNQPKETKWK